MDEKQFALLLGQIGDLSPAQFKELVKTYAGQSGQDARRVWEASVYATSEQRLADLEVNRACPGCGSVAVVHNGLTDAGIQRFHCQDCGKSFTRFTGTLLEKSRFPWDVWVQVLKMVLKDDSLQDIQTVLEQDFACEGINIKTVFVMRMKLIHAMAAIEPPKLIGVIQMDESFVRESQKGHNLELVSYIKDEERFPRYGRKPSKYGTMGPEFATILTAIDSRGHCVCKVVALGWTVSDAVIDLYEQHCFDAAYLCSDANAIYQEACDLLDIAHYVKPSNYNTLIERAGYLYPDSGKPPDERRTYNHALLERLYREGKIDYIAHREDLTYDNFAHIKKTYHLSLARVNELHADIKLMIEKKMTNVATKYLADYMGFFTFRRNWRVDHGHSPANRRDAEIILRDLLTRGNNLTRPAMEQIRLALPKPSVRAVQILKQKTEKDREITKNKYFKYNSEDVPSFNVRKILEDAPRSHLNEIAKEALIKCVCGALRIFFTANLLRFLAIHTSMPAKSRLFAVKNLSQTALADLISPSLKPDGHTTTVGRYPVEESILTLMRQKYDSFTRSERKIVDYVLEHQKQTQYISITDLSTECKVAVSTVSLFCRKLKLAGFNDFKLELARAALPAGANASRQQGEITPEDSPGLVMGKVLRTVQDELDNAYHMLTAADVTRAVDLMRAAGQVICLGQGNHSVVALAAWAQFSTTSPKFKTIQDSHMQTVALSTLTPEDVVLYFSYSGATHEVLAAAEVIRNRGAKLILVTRYLNSPASAYADTVLLCGPNEQPFQFGSSAALIAQLYVVEVLLSEFVRRAPEEAEHNRQSVGKALTQKCI